MHIARLNNFLLATLLHTALASTAGATCFPQSAMMFSTFDLVAPRVRVTDDERTLILQRLSSVYAQEIAAAGGRLEIVEPARMDFAAEARRENGGFVIAINRGVRYHQKMNADTYALIACHEIGHHLGGVPLRSGSWGSVEGQADYFATLACMRRYYGTMSGAELFSRNLSLRAVERCQKFSSRREDLQACGRALEAGLTAASIDRELSEIPQDEPALEKEDPAVTTFLVEDHPLSQCRLDTFKAGALEQERSRCWYMPSAYAVD